MANELYNDDKYITINTEYAEAYIPDEIFLSATKDPTASTVAYDTGESIVTIGIFYMRFFDTSEVTDELREKTKVRTLNYPNKIECKPSGTMEKKKLIINGQEDKYRIYKFYKGDILMESSSKKSYLNADMSTSMVMSGKLPRSLAYDELFFSWLASFKINNISTGIPPALMQAIVAKMCCTEDDPNVPFRELAGSRRGADPHSYRMLSMNQVSSYSSVMSSMAFERFADKLTSSLVMTGEGLEQKPSPIEKLITI